MLDVHGAAALLMVSADTVYDLFGRSELPGRKVGRKWITTRSAVLRWIENTSTDDALIRAIERGDGEALAKAMNNGKLKLRPRVVNRSNTPWRDPRRSRIFTRP
ncbi:MAG: helix-turn-helix domain-containing protein [Stellaceae bacterium]